MWYNMYVRNERGIKMDTTVLIMLALSGMLIGILVGMAFAVDFECDKKYGKAILTYFVCIVIYALVFVMPVLILCM